MEQVKINSARIKVADRLETLGKHMEAIKVFWDKPGIINNHIDEMKPIVEQLKAHLHRLKLECKK